ncbi:DinB family protein [Ulvibacterium marinum]|uniref:DUF1572 domain-containing protein n=1 Tax=Ulvibacterium marinum TaxID=2419782 RepID=A0A3B0BZU3_9FLAO|nr:DinB family protein [Ulvibacterium marinum]RKN78520.1 DUF1572 domain-containing protein [Ulvibacterium marinum]
MKSSIQLANRFREVILNGKWIANTNVQDQLRNVTLEQAVTEIDNLNTIAKLTFHLNYYISGVLNVFEGGNLEIRDKFSFDLPKMNSEQEWSDLTTNLFSNAEKFANHVEHMSEEKLNAEFVNTDYGDFRRNIEGMIEHSYYHLGQIVLLRKMLDQ